MKVQVYLIRPNISSSQIKKDSDRRRVLEKVYSLLIEFAEEEEICAKFQVFEDTVENSNITIPE